MAGVGGAFILGVRSATSLALGATTARLWKPTNFVLGLLTAFGAGALLSGVNIDIVAPAVELRRLAEKLNPPPEVSRRLDRGSARWRHMHGSVDENPHRSRRRLPLALGRSVRYI